MYGIKTSKIYKSICIKMENCFNYRTNSDTPLNMFHSDVPKPYTAWAITTAKFINAPVSLAILLSNNSGTLQSDVQ